MIYDKEQLGHYIDVIGSDLIPLHAWNKKRKAQGRVKEIGKNPIHNEWTTRDYTGQNSDYLDKGMNAGYRIPEDEVIIDLDPRNYVDDIDSEAEVANYLGLDNFDDVIWEYPVVRTGSGGYHIYCKLPEGCEYKLIRKAVAVLPGVDFKKKGGYVVAAGSKHPNGEYYTWENQGEPTQIHPNMLALISREMLVDKDYKAGYGAFTGQQLETMVLDKLDVENYSSNDTWEPLLMSCHHATAGEGIEEFLNWSLQDLEYSQDEHAIRCRWDSLDNNKSVQRTAASLILELKNIGEETSDAKAVLDFSTRIDTDSFDDEDTEESRMLKEAKEAADKIDKSDIMELPKNVSNVKGEAIEMAKELSKNCTIEEKMMCIRLIKAASIEESIEAQEILVSRKIINQSGINKRLKALDEKIIDSIVEVLANTSIDAVFNSGKHVITEPNGQIWTFNKTHWKEMSEEYLGKIVYGVLDTLKTKMEIKTVEVSLVGLAVRAIKMRASILSTRLHDPDNHASIINCKNGEVWISKDGTHKLRPHNYRSYQIRCLNVDYDPSAECPLFLDTLNGIFKLYPDTEDIIRHLGEVLGYIIQPYKPDANWWMFKGPGGDGKSTILKVLSAILGDSYKPSDQTLLGANSSGGNAHASAGLVGKLAIAIEELEKGTILRDSGLKMLSENTRMTANPKNLGEFSFNYIGSLIMSSNFYPTIRDTSEGTMRRANVFPFNRKFVKNKLDDADRATNIVQNREELAGVLNFMLEGYERYRNRGGFQVPTSCQDAKEEWMAQANNVIRFAKENIIPTEVDDKLDKASEVYLRYESWCMLNGVKSKGRNNFYNDMADIGYRSAKTGGNVMMMYGGEMLDEELDDF